MKYQFIIIFKKKSDMNIKLRISLLLAVLTILNLHAQKNIHAFKIYNSEGKEIKWQKMLKDLPSADVIFFGELHNDPISHWMELKITEAVHKEKEGKIILGAEMFETDQQLILNEYTQGTIDAKRFEAGTHLWNNYKTDYKPLVKLAVDSSLKFIATNIPRRYANLVSKNGFEVLEGLDEQAKALIAPLPINYDAQLPPYQKMMQMSMGHGEPDPNFPKAQASKDATMAWFIHKNFEKGSAFIHYNGAFHSDFHDGIVWYLLQLNPELVIKTITTVLQEDVEKLEEENLQRADFIIVVADDMIRTY